MDSREKVLRDGLVYKSRFRLPRAEADFVCALGRVMGLSPDDALAFLVRWFAESDRPFAKYVFSRARRDGRGPWR